MGIRRWNKNSVVWESFGSPQLDPASIGAAPSLHAVQHLVGGTDAITPTGIGAVAASSGVVTLAPTNSTVVRNITVSTSTPSGGSDGDVWLKYS
jgi:hypothetical protein